MRSLWLGVVALGLAACAAPGPAPVSERTSTQGGAKPHTAKSATPQIAPSTSGLHTVQRGDTLYAIAFANNLDYREVAGWNQLESADRILVGQVLRLTPPPGVVETEPLDEPPPPSARPIDEPPLVHAPQAVLLAYSDANWTRVTQAPTDAEKQRTEARTPLNTPAVPAAALAMAKPASVETAPPAPAEPAAAASAAVDRWLWPADGQLAGRFGAAGGKGIDIVGPRDTPVKAVASGKVVYSGTGLRGYGQLLIIKHTGEFLSAYAHNDNVLVKEGDVVKAGQKIALMGDSDADRVKLHFEIRRYGKPLDPLDYLPERP